MSRLIVLVVFALVVGFLIYARTQSTAQATLLEGLLASIAGGFFVLAAQFLWNLVVPIGLFKVRLVSVFRRKRDLRVSMAALIRLEIGDKILLVRNLKAGPPAAFGGALKYFRSAENEIKNKLHASASNFADHDNPDDEEKFARELRLKMPVTELTNFLRWFENGSGREHYPLREFWEELQEAGLQNIDSFETPEFGRYQRVRTIRWEPQNQWYSLLSFEVWEAQIDQDLEQAILELSRRSSDIPGGIVLATLDDLRKQRMPNGTILGDNVWCLDNSIPLPKGFWRW